MSNDNSISAEVHDHIVKISEEIFRRRQEENNWIINDVYKSMHTIGYQIEKGDN